MILQRDFKIFNFFIFLFFYLIINVDSWWLMSQMTSTQLKSNYCGQLVGLSRRQRSLCFQNEEAVRATHRGLLGALNECRIQFSRELWDCTTASVEDESIGNKPLENASRENAYVYAISAGGASHEIAKECAKGTINGCSCGQNPQNTNTKKYFPESKQRRYIHGTNANGDSKQFTWEGCSDNLKYANKFSRKFIDNNEKKSLTDRALVNLHNYRVGRRLLSSMMTRNCKCHGVSGSCISLTCWRKVPSFEEYAAALKKKYEKAQKVKQLEDNSIELVVLHDPVPSLVNRVGMRNERNLASYNPEINANRDALVYLEASPDYCTTSGTSGRECFLETECAQLCCTRSWHTINEVRQEPCKCKFIWCCNVKCDTCWRDIQRFFCN